MLYGCNTNSSYIVDGGYLYLTQCSPEVYHKEAFGFLVWFLILSIYLNSACLSVFVYVIDVNGVFCVRTKI